MGRAPKTKVTAGGLAVSPAEATTDAAVQTAAEGEGSGAPGTVAVQTATEGDGSGAPSTVADQTIPEGDGSGALGTASDPVPGNTQSDAPQSDPPPPDDSGADVLALVVSPILHDGAMLQIDATPLLSPADFAKLATAGAVIRAVVD